MATAPSGIIEAPSFNTPTVNIGDRQKGRMQTASVLNCLPQESAICQTVGCALSPEFRESISGISNPYEQPNTCATIVRLLTDTSIESLSKKVFFDLKQP